jgi:hypothetical protein
MKSVDDVYQDILEHLRRHEYDKIKQEILAHNKEMLDELEKEILLLADNEFSISGRRIISATQIKQKIAALKGGL